MDLQLRRKDVEYNFPYIIKVGYCELQYTLKALDMERLGYACGVNGWNCDVYRLEKGIALQLDTVPLAMSAWTLIGLERLRRRYRLFLGSTTISAHR